MTDRGLSGKSHVRDRSLGSEFRVEGIFPIVMAYVTLSFLLLNIHAMIFFGCCCCSEVLVFGGHQEDLPFLKFRMHA